MNNNNSCCMLVVTHKNVVIEPLPAYQPIIVGNSTFDIDNAWHDNTGDNIACKNPSFCELTALYWYWKNKIDDYNIIGLSHYRRYFTTNLFSDKSQYFLKDSEMQAILKESDIILPQRFHWLRYTVAEKYYKGGNGKQADLLGMRKCINEICPEYIPSFDEVMEGHSASYCNMFVAKKEMAATYFEWLFRLLFQMEAITDIRHYNDAERRIFGYLGELLLNVWVAHNGLRVATIPTVLVGKSPVYKCSQYFNLKRTLHENA